MSAPVGQSALWSLIESGTQVFTGTLVSILMYWLVLGPWFGIPFNLFEALAVTALFTLSSLARQFIVRRLFARMTERRSV